LGIIVNVCCHLFTNTQAGAKHFVFQSGCPPTLLKNSGGVKSSVLCLACQIRETCDHLFKMGFSFYGFVGPLDMVINPCHQKKNVACLLGFAKSRYPALLQQRSLLARSRDASLRFVSLLDAHLKTLDVSPGKSGKEAAIHGH
jgi:hypothetical protein